MDTTKPIEHKIDDAAIAIEAALALLDASPISAKTKKQLAKYLSASKTELFKVYQVLATQQ